MKIIDYNINKIYCKVKMMKFKFKYNKNKKNNNYKINIKINIIKILINRKIEYNN